MTLTLSRHFIFKHYWWIGLIFGIILCVLLYIYGGPDRIAFIGTTIAGVFGFFYFIQQQKLAETQLFYELFTSFNVRYNELNDALSAIAYRNDNNLSTDNKNLIIDYFNICAEEYLFFREGYIYHDVWKSWCRGMLWYLRRHPFRDIWNEEIKTDSFYGLTLKIIEEGAI